MGFVVLWLLHVIGWFLLSYAAAILNGRANAIRILNAVAIGTVSFGFHLLLRYYTGGTL